MEIQETSAAGAGNTALRSDLLQAIRQEAASDLNMMSTKKYVKEHFYEKGGHSKGSKYTKSKRP